MVLAARIGIQQRVFLSARGRVVRVGFGAAGRAHFGQLYSSARCKRAPSAALLLTDSPVSHS